VSKRRILFGMGNLATAEALVLRWEEVCRDPSLQDLPYKIELNAWGKIEMSPASNRHGRLQAALAAEFTRQLPDGMTLTECSVLTGIGIRVPDVVWASARFMAAYGEITPYTRAPEICVEILSPSNVEAEIEEKTRAYLKAGAEEVWLVSESGSIRFMSAEGESAKSSFPLAVSLPRPIGS
jgi:Uma2 family endonuclease